MSKARKYITSIGISTWINWMGFLALYVILVSDTYLRSTFLSGGGTVIPVYRDNSSCLREGLIEPGTFFHGTWSLVEMVIKQTKHYKKDPDFIGVNVYVLPSKYDLDTSIPRAISSVLGYTSFGLSGLAFTIFIVYVILMRYRIQYCIDIVFRVVFYSVYVMSKVTLLGGFIFYAAFIHVYNLSTNDLEPSYLQIIGIVFFSAYAFGIIIDTITSLVCIKTVFFKEEQDERYEFVHPFLQT